MAIISTVTQQCDQAVTEFHSNKIVDYRLIFQSGIRHGEGQSIIGASVVHGDTAREGPVEGVSCRAHELLQGTNKEVNC
jgi:hypothetical protein